MTKELDRILADRLESMTRPVPYRAIDYRFADRPRSWWFREQSKEEITQCVLHHTATEPTVDPMVIYTDHLQRFGGIGYHFLIYCTRVERGVKREVYRVRSPLTWGAHVKGKNDGRLGIAWVGDYRFLGDSGLLVAFEEVFTVLVRGIKEWVGHDISVTAHRLLLPGYTECPGGEWVETLVERVNRVLRADRDSTWDEYKRGFEDGRKAMWEEIWRTLKSLEPRR